MYDPEDYIEEFAELTDLGLSAREIVARCTPPQQWFRRNVFPYVTKALCISCRSYFNMSLVTKGTECSAICRNAYTGFGNQGARVTTWTQQERYLSARSALRTGQLPQGTGTSRMAAASAGTTSTEVAVVTT